MITRVTNARYQKEQSLVKPRPTQQQIAEEAGVSRTTVSLVLNDVPDVRVSPETRQRILKVAQRLNYYPHAAARRLVSGKTSTIGLVWHRGPNPAYRDAFIPGFLQGVARAAHKYGYHVLFRPIEPNEPDSSYVELARSRHIDGFILSGPRSDDAHLLKLHAERFPIVLHGQLPGTDILSVDIDNVQGARVAVNHLLALGHRRIGIITNAPLVYTASQQRMEGYNQALEQTDIVYDECLVQEGNFDGESGQSAMQDLLACDPPPTAVFVASDMVAMGALQAIRDRGLHVPEDIAIVGFDDITAARFVTPALTTVRVPTFGLGWSAAEMLIDLIKQDVITQTHTFLETELIVRDSCGASPAL
jgi:DNA-binding LacI/PurR family transcriptional regulator